MLSHPNPMDPYTPCHTPSPVISAPHTQLTVSSQGLEKPLGECLLQPLGVQAARR